VVASHDSKKPSAVRENTLFNIFNPGAVYTNGHFVFRLACDCTCMTSDTFSIIKNKSVFHPILLSFLYL
jgi:hypothetical protein